MPETQVLRILHVTQPSAAGESWLAAALKDAPRWKVDLTVAAGAFDGMKALQTAPFDVLLITDRPPEFDAWAFVSGSRTAGFANPIFVAGHGKLLGKLTAARRAGAEDFIHLDGTNVDELLWKMNRAVAQNRALHENADLLQKLNRHILRENDENRKALAAQRERLAARQVADCTDFDSEYDALLRAWIPSESGTLSKEISDFCSDLKRKRLGIPDFLAIHLRVVETMAGTLGKRRLQPILQRARMLELEVLLGLSSK